MTDLNNAIELLYSLRNIDNEIREQIDLLDQLRSVVTSVTVSTDKEAVQSSGSKDKMAGIIAKIVDLENEINAKTDGLINRKNIVKEVIFSIEKENYQDLLYDYFICNIPLWQISENMGITYDACKKQLSRAKRCFERMFDSKKKQKIQHIVENIKENK